MELTMAQRKAVTRAGAPVPACHAAGERRDPGSVGATQRLHAQSRQCVACAAGAAPCTATRVADRSRSWSDNGPRGATARGGTTRKVYRALKPTLGVVRRDVQQALGGGAASPVSGAGEIRRAQPRTAGARHSAAHQRRHHRTATERGEAQAAALRALPHQAQYPAAASDPDPHLHRVAVCQARRRWAPIWRGTTAAVSMHSRCSRTTASRSRPSCVRC